MPLPVTRSCLGTLTCSLGLLIAACDGTSTDDAGNADAPPVTPMIEIGTGEIEFEPITDGQDLEYIQGPQGGYHFLASVRVQGVDPGDPDDLLFEGNPTTEFTAWVDDARVDLMASRYVQGLRPAMGVPGYEMLGRLLILDVADNEELRDTTTRIEVTVTDVDGVELTDSRTVVAVPNPRNM